MIVIRFFVGFFKTLVNLWGWSEWFYYNKTGLDPKLPAFQRWEIFTREEDKTPESRAEELLPRKNIWVILRDKFMQSPEEVLFYSTDNDKVKALTEEYNRELRTRTSGDFYYSMIKGRNLDFVHHLKPTTEPLVEGTEIDPEQEREKFLR